LALRFPNQQLEPERTEVEIRHWQSSPLSTHRGFDDKVAPAVVHLPPGRAESFQMQLSNCAACFAGAFFFGHILTSALPGDKLLLSLPVAAQYTIKSTASAGNRKLLFSTNPAGSNPAKTGTADTRNIRVNRSLIMLRRLLLTASQGQ